MAVKGASSRQGPAPISFLVFPLAGVLLAHLGHLLLLQGPVAVRSGWGWSAPAPPRPRPQPRPAPSPSPSPSSSSSSNGGSYESTVASRKPKDTVTDDTEANGATPRTSKPFWRSFFFFPVLGFLVVHIGPLLGLMKEPSLAVHSGWGWSSGDDEKKEVKKKDEKKGEKEEETIPSETSNAAALVGKKFFLATWPMAWWRMMT